MNNIVTGIGKDNVISSTRCNLIITKRSRIKSIFNLRTIGICNGRNVILLEITISIEIIFNML